MKKRLYAVTLLIAPLFTQAGGDPAPAELRAMEFERASKTAVQQLGKQLKSELVAAMKEGGPVNAIEVCNLRAPQIAEQISTQEDLTVGRTALRVRNPVNQPDEWETAVMQSFQQQLTDGASAENLQVTQQVETKDGGTELRYMRAIVTQDVCVMCHGPSEQLAPALKTRLQELYPEDQAVGFQSGDLRGAFTVVKNLPSKEPQ